MPGSNAGTGRPLFFHCAQCRARKGAVGHWLPRRDGRNVVLTGRIRRNPRHNAGIRNSRCDREYRCLDCGHVGWSRHTDLTSRTLEKHHWACASRVSEGKDCTCDMHRMVSALVDA